MAALLLVSVSATLLAFFAFAVAINPDSSNLHGISQSEYDALHALYNSTIGDGWDCAEYGGEVNWRFTEDANPCAENWDGVTCGATDNGAQFVVELRLNNCSLNGTLPLSLGNLSFVEVLDLGYNELSGPLPATLEQMTVLNELYLNWNFFSGFFPPVITRLFSLEMLDLSDNSFQGPIPWDIGDLERLEKLALSWNAFTQSLPSSLTLLLVQLRTLRLDDNRFNGSVPSDIGNLGQLLELDLTGNEFSQSLPASLTELAQLKTLILVGNSFNGSVPSAIGNLLNLETLDLSWNSFSQSLPASLTALAQLQTLQLNDNRFIGSVPSAVGNLLNLETLDLSWNSFSQSLPASLSQLVNLRVLNLIHNQFKGSIPSDIGNLEKLEELLLYYNKFSQTLPDSIGQLSLLQRLDVYHNRFDGTVPTSFAHLANLMLVDLSLNAFNGILPDVFADMKSLKSLHLAGNRFVGPVPQSIGQLTALSTLHLSNNSFTGTLPAQIATMTELRLLTVEKNFLHGALSELINSQFQKQLETVLVSGNRFGGTLPEDLFRIKSLRQVYCDNNCIRGSLPSNICDNKLLEVLSLNGLHTSKHCRDPLVYGRRDIYTVSEELQGGIRQCLYELPRLQLLDLSSNGIHGTLPNGVIMSSTLTTLALSHNRLTGTVPEEYQRKPWQKLDLSFNRLRGQLSDDFVVAEASDIKLRSNRLSGPVPHSFLYAPTIDVLTGNMFSCSLDVTGQLDRSELPEQDEGLPTFQCGSSTFLYAYAVWSALLLLLFAVLLYKARIRRANIRLADTVLAVAAKLRTYLDIAELNSSKGESHLPRLRRYHKIIATCRLYLSIIAGATAFTLVVLLPLYSGLSGSEWKYSSTRAYDVSIIYMSGQVPAAVCLVALVVLLASVYAYFVRCLRGYRCACTKFESTINYQVALEPLSMRESATVEEPVFTRQKVAVYAGCLLVDLVAVFSANIWFVMAVKEADQKYLLPAQMALAAFKTVWGTVCGWVVNYLAVKSQVESRNLKRGLLFVLIAVTLFNNIVVPCLVVLAVSSTCFYDIMTPGDSVSTKAQVVDCVGKCDGNGRGGYEYSSVPVEFRPPFVYSYQCSASFVTYYVASFVLMYIFNGFVMPAFRYGVFLIAPHLKEGQFCHTWLYPYVSKVLKPVTAASPVPARYFDARKLVVSLVNNLGILLTFGAVFPPLAATVCVASFCRVYFLRMETKRLLRCAAALDRQDIIERVDADCAFVGSESMIIRSIWLLIVMSAWFYSLFLFDTLGDDVGFGGAYCVLIIMFLLPLVAYSSFRVYTGTVFVRRRERVVSSLSSQSAAVVELALRLQQAVAAAGAEVRSPMAPPEDQVKEAEEEGSSV